VGGGDALDLLKVQIFFDFRNIYGDPGIEEELRGHLEQGVAGNHRFFQILARNILQSTPPVGFFGQFVVETEGPGRGSFNIKNAMMPLVDSARIYAMKHAVRSVSTIQRLDDLLTLNILNNASHADMVQTFADLMQLRLKVQAMAAGSAWSLPSNRIFPKSLDKGEQKHLKELFSRIRNFQARLSYDFTGQLGI
jgi:CBS domain-containing protein